MCRAFVLLTIYIWILINYIYIHHMKKVLHILLALVIVIGVNLTAEAETAVNKAKVDVSEHDSYVDYDAVTVAFENYTHNNAVQYVGQAITNVVESEGLENVVELEARGSPDLDCLFLSFKRKDYCNVNAYQDTGNHRFTHSK